MRKKAKKTIELEAQAQEFKRKGHWWFTGAFTHEAAVKNEQKRAYK